MAKEILTSAPIRGQDLTGKRFGKLSVIGFSHKTKEETGKIRLFWRCLCDCGNPSVSRGDQMKAGRALSCGCSQSKMFESYKFCRRCKTSKPSEEFSVYRLLSGRTRRVSCCRPCANEMSRFYARRWKAANPDESKLRQKLSSLATRYRISRETVKAMYANYNGRCPICDTPTPNPCVDHCHSTGKVRAFLCLKCNFGLGYFLDNPELLLKAADYLKSHLSDK